MTRFRALPQFDTPELIRTARVRHRLDARAAEVFGGRSLADRLARALAEHGAISVKELLEAFEFFAVVRRRVRSPHVADLCCGHGLCGLLFATERSVERVTLVDHRIPASMEPIRRAIASVRPEIDDKVVVRAQPLTEVSLEPGTGVVAVHACGARTDRCLDAGIAAGGPIAVMPCCYGGTAKHPPAALRAELGAERAVDVHRTYRLEGAGYRVEWAYIPEAITPMNRVLVARPRPSGR